MVKKDFSWFNPEVVSNIVNYLKGSEPQCFLAICFLAGKSMDENGRFRIMYRDIVNHSGLCLRSVVYLTSFLVSVKLLERVKIGRTYEYSFCDGNIRATNAVLKKNQGIAPFIRGVLGNRPVFTVTASDIADASILKARKILENSKKK